MKLFSFLDQFWHQRLRVPYKLHAEIDGKQDGPVIILLHGIATSSRGWDKLVGELAPRFRCVSIDLLGHGQSPMPLHAAYTPEQHVASIRRTVRSLRLKRPYIVAGHSLGSLLAAKYVGKYQKEVARFYMLSPPIYLGTASPQKGYANLRTATYLRAYAYLRTHKRFTLVGAKKLKSLLRLNVVSLNEESWLAFSRSLEQCIENQDVITDISRSKTPTIIAYGLRDPLIIPKEIRLLSKQFDHVEAKRLNIGHTMTESYINQVATLLYK